MELVDRLLARDVRALARAISLAEEGAPEAREVQRACFPRTGRATIVGVTGAPGAGKSSLVDRMIAHWRGRGRRVGVVAVDPSSAFSGGAILGDRVRMQAHATDADVFIRSMATRGHLGGLARATGDVVDLMDAAGFDPVLVETVGVGQDEVDIVRAADAVCVVLVPGMGDDIQAIKAGILEIADLFVINKADRAGADRLAADLETMLTLVPSAGPKPPILPTVAVQDQGVPAVLDAVEACVAALGEEGRARRRRDRAEARFRALLAERLLAAALARALPGDALQQAVAEIADRRTDPYTAVDAVLARTLARSGREAP
ncbi:MAG TPA: methylmalonyl Co-A mutase-associated GTPase MeaB [Candidatus Polarisedimenticolaceae bacterium]|nr:methylmalonyl Co-A mutase-associated GTPase MeaB [Candidatus Polarisedimenticolaceae bacterium]